MTDLTNEQIQELRFNVAIERFNSFDEYMEIPGYECEPEMTRELEITPSIIEFIEYQQNLKKRFEACKQRYKGMEEHMEIPDMDLWLKLKSEIITKYYEMFYANAEDCVEEEDDYYDKEEYSFARIKDNYLYRYADKLEDRFN